MAIARGAGTEIIRVHNTQIVDSTNSILIEGVQHHIYTVLSIIIFAQSAQGVTGSSIKAWVQGYDNKLAVTNTPTFIFHQEISEQATFVWNDKFGFNGHEPVDFTGNIDSIAKQDAIADQGSAVPQKLMARAENGSDGFDINVTFIDQNNA